MQRELERFREEEALRLALRASSATATATATKATNAAELVENEEPKVLFSDDALLSG